MKERPFSVALFFGVIWIVLPCLGNFVELPVWDNLNIGLCGLALILCICVYLTEYLGLFPLNYRWVNLSLINIINSLFFRNKLLSTSLRCLTPRIKLYLTVIKIAVKYNASISLEIKHTFPSPSPPRLPLRRLNFWRMRLVRLHFCHQWAKTVYKCLTQMPDLMVNSFVKARSATITFLTS